jgi:hypothetical protein
VFILKGLEVLCFDTDLQVFILKVLTGRAGTWVLLVRYATPVFLSKSAQPTENKGSEVVKKLQESLRVRKRLKS